MNAGRAAVILTPEHVPVRVVPAGPGSRFLAFLVDAALIAALATLSQVVLISIVPFGLGAAGAVAAAFILTWGYHVYFEVYCQGRSPGKRLCRLRVIDGRGLAVSPQQSFVRNIVRMLDFAPLLYGLGGLVSLFDRHHRRLGDIAAGTLVIKEEEPLDHSRHFAETRRFNSLRTPRVLRHIRHRIGLEEREFLLALCLRAGRMEEKARFDLMEEVAGCYRRALEIDDPSLSGENLVRDLTSILYGG